MALAAILAAKAEVPLSIRIGSQHAGRVQVLGFVFLDLPFFFGFFFILLFFDAIAATIPFS